MARALGKPAAPALVVQKLNTARWQGREAEAQRRDLVVPGVTRTVLFPEIETKPAEGNKTAALNVEPLRFHDFWAPFVIWAKRAGQGDGWISDLTGYFTPEMIDWSRTA